MKNIINNSDVINSNLLIMILVISVSGAILLPMLPIWEGMIRVAASCVVFRYYNTQRNVVFFLSLVAFIVLLTLAYEIIGSPLQILYNSIFNINGAQFSISSSIVLALVDSFLVFFLIYLLFNNSNKLLVFIVGACFIWPNIVFFQKTYYFLFEIENSNQVNLSDLADDIKLQILKELTDRRLSKLEKLIAGNGNWNNWILTFLTSIWVLRFFDIKVQLLKVIVLCGCMLASIMLLQFFILDYSYVLDHPDMHEYFYRVKGTYYYHSAASLALSVCFCASIALIDTKRIVITIFPILYIGFVIWLNSTRAISLALTVILTLYVIFILIDRKSYGRLLVPALLLPLFISAIFYEKPDLEVSKESTGAEFGDVQALAKSNMARLDLLSVSVREIYKAPITGQGFNLVEIPLTGKVFGGELATYSSHSLFFDIALSAGYPTLFFFIVLLLYISKKMLYQYSSNKREGLPCDDAAAFVGLMIFFCITGMFFPQERNLTIPIIFLLFSLVFVSEKKRVCKNKKIYMKVCWIVFFISIIWAAILSSSYTFPVAEFIFKHYGKFGTSSKDRIYTNSKLIEKLLQLSLNGVLNKGISIEVLQDEKYMELEQKSWILWSSSREEDYPVFIKYNGYPYYRKYGLSPGVKLPEHWQLVDTSQSVVSIIRVGDNPDYKIKLKAIGEVQTSGYINEDDWMYLLPDTEFKLKVTLDEVVNFEGLNIEFNSDVNTILNIRDITKSTFREENKGNIQIEYIGSNKKHNIYLSAKKNKTISLSFNSSKSSKIRLRFLDVVRPDVLVESYASDDGVNWVRRLAVNDYKLTTSWVNRVEKNNSIIFDLGNSALEKIKYYRFYGMHSIDRTELSPTSWEVLISDDMKKWDLLDRVEEYHLPEGFNKHSDFIVREKLAKRYIKFNFLKPEKSKIGLNKIELFTVPSRMNDA